MKKFLALGLVCIVMSVHVKAQNPTVSWAGSATSQVSPGNQIINIANATAVDAAGNLYVTGYFYGTVDFDFSAAGTANLTSAGGRDIFIAKYDADGKYKWAHTIGSSGEEVANAIAVKDTSVVITGWYSGTLDFDPGSGVASKPGGNPTNTFIEKFNTNTGNYVWVNVVSGYSRGAGVAFDNANDIFLTGAFSGACDFIPGSDKGDVVSKGGEDIYLAKYDSTGVAVWGEAMGGAGGDAGTAISIRGENIYLAGYFASPTIDMDPWLSNKVLTRAGSQDCFIAMYDVNGHLSFADDIGGSSGSGAITPHALVAGERSLAIAGSFSNTIDFNPAAAVANITSSSSTDVFFAKYSLDGDYMWAKSVEGSGPDECYSIAQDKQGNVYITGNIGGNADFDPAPASTVTLYPSGFDIFLAIYNTDGNYIWAKNFGSSSNSNTGSAVAVDNTSALLLTGTFTKDIDFDPGFGTAELTTNPVGILFNGDIFTVKYAVDKLLPVGLLSFTGQRAGKEVVLNWSTAYELDNEKFVVERSTDALHFATVTEVAGKGTTQVKSDYSAYDAYPAAGLNYYRLKQVNADNKYTYSKTISVNFGGQVTLGVYPNPASKILNAVFDAATYHTAQLIGADGKIIASAKSATGIVNFNLQQLPAGVYYVRFIGKSNTISNQVIKQ